MDEKIDSINAKNIIMLARNTPVALVVGAAGFLGSSLSEALLDKGIQVVGVDDYSSGNKENLETAVKNKHFHFINSDAGKLSLNLDRLDYIFISASGFNLENILYLFDEKKARVLFVSWIDLYERHPEGKLGWFKETEGKLARFASDKKLNARILRLGSVFGPRMNFDSDDPVVKLIGAQLSNEIQKEQSLEFSSRSLFVSDAVELMIKAMLKGSTAQKIFDGVNSPPVQVSEIKQVLMDPLWYENRQFTPSELPPWPTPNLERTMKFLSWKPKVGLVKALKETVAYFKDRQIKIPKLGIEPPKEPVKVAEGWKEEKIGELEGFKAVASKSKETKRGFKFEFKPKFSLSKVYWLLVTIVIVFALIYPIAAIGLGIVTFRLELSQASAALSKGEFDKSLSSLAWAKVGVDEAKSIVDSLEVVRKVNILNSQFDEADNLLEIADSSIASVQSAVRGVQELYLGLRATSGDIPDPPFAYFDGAHTDLVSADDNISSAIALLGSSRFKSGVPAFLNSQILKLDSYLTSFEGVIKKGEDASVLLPQIISSNKSYLLLLQNNMELRPTGGFIGSYGLVSFEGGKIKKLEVNDIYAIDGQLKIHVDPPKAIAEDLGQKDWYLRDSNFEPDFPTSAKQAEWFFNKETGVEVAGVIALDVTSMENLLRVVGPIDLSDYKETITADNLFSKAVAHAEQNFFAGSQAKKSFLTGLTNELFNKIFFLPNQNWPGIVSALGKSLQDKHISVFLDDRTLLSYLISQNWAGVMPRPQQATAGVFNDFLAPVEANLGGNKANYYLDRSYDLQTAIGKDGQVSHRLKINYTNKSPSDTWPGGLYKDRFRIYLPLGTKLNRVLWGETDITKDVTAFVDYGRSGYSMLLELAPKEEKALILDYELPKSLDFVGNKATYRLDVIKQAGLLNDAFNWTISYPINYQVQSQGQAIGPQEQTIKTDLSKDRSFEINFTRT